MNNLFLILAEGGGGGTSMVGFIAYIVILFGFMYFILIRPQRKRQKAVDQMQSDIKVGDSVMTNGGLYGKVVDIVNDVVILELGTNKSVRVPIQRSALAAIKEPDLSINKSEDVEEVKEISEDKSNESKSNK